MKLTIKLYFNNLSFMHSVSKLMPTVGIGLFSFDEGGIFIQGYLCQIDNSSATYQIMMAFPSLD